MTERGRPALPPQSRAVALAAERWEVDVFPVSTSLKEGPRGRTVLSLVVAGGPVIDSDLAVSRTADPGVLGRQLVDAVQRAAERMGEWPRTIAVRHVEFADVLAPAIPKRGCDLVVSPRLPELDEAAESLLEHLLGGPAWPPRGEPDTWDAWGYPRELVSDLFRAWARVHRAAPWTRLPESRPIFVSGGGGPDSVISVLGEAGVQRAIVLYHEVDDYIGMLGADDSASAFASFVAPVVFIGSSERSELPPKMQREVLSAGWEVAAPDAYPHLMTFQSPGGCLTVEGARHLVRVLDGVADLTERAGEHLSGPDPMEYRKDGLTLALPPDESDSDWHGTLRDELDGIEFEDEAQLREWLAARVDRQNTSPHEELSGLSPVQAQRLLEEGFQDGSPLHIATDAGDSLLDESPFVHNARVMLLALVEDGGTNATKAGNLTRAFVARMSEAMRWREGELELIHDVNRVVNEDDAPRVHHARIMLELAGLIRRRRARFVATREGTALTSPGAVGTLTARLFRAHFRDFNLAYLDGLPEKPAFQHVAPLTLWRISVEGREWSTAGELADRVLPPSLRHVSPDFPGADSGAIRFEQRIVRPLLEFGLLEEAPERAPPANALHRARLGRVRVAPLFDRMIRFDWGD